MPGSIELKRQERLIEGQQPKQPRILRVPGPAVRQEAVSSDDMTVEQWVLRASHAQHLGDIPFGVARQAVVIDALDYALTIRERVALIAHRLFAMDGDLDSVKQYLGFKDYLQIDPLVDSVVDNSQSSLSNLKLGDCAREVSEVEMLLESIGSSPSRDNQDRDRLKAVVEEILKLQGDGLSSEQISARKLEIQQKTRLKPPAK